MPKLFFYFHDIHRLRRLCSISSSPSFLSRSLHSHQNPNPLFSPLTYHNYRDKPQSQSQSPQFNSINASLALFHFVPLRSFSIHSPTNTSEHEGVTYDVTSPSTNCENSELLDSGFNGGDGCSEVAEGVVSGSEWYAPLVSTLISVLDGYHDLTGLPWWIIIVSSTIALRMALLPLLIFQLQKMKIFSELFPKLPPPFPPLLSGKSYIKQYLLFRKAKQAIGCPSALWGLSTLSVQVPCFLLWMTSIRKMSMDHHPGFDCGGILWFQNLTEIPHGYLSPIFPVLIAGLHFINVQVSFKMARVGKVTGILGMIAEYYKIYLNILTVPICLIGFCVPQGSLVYWATNSSLTLVQQLFLSHPAIREELGLPDINPKKIKKPDVHEVTLSSTEGKRKMEDLSPDELVHLSVQHMARDRKRQATSLLLLALEKDPDNIRALVLLGQALKEQRMLTESIRHLEHAISKLSIVESPSTEDVYLLILASTWAGAMHLEQENKEAGLEHFERIVKMVEPEEPQSKKHYFEGLTILSGYLYNEGEKEKAAVHMRRAAAYDYKQYNELLQLCLADSNPQDQQKED